MAKKANQKPVTPRTAAVAKPAVAKEPQAKGGMPVYTKLAILLGVISCLLYFNTLKNDYVLDDFTVIKNNSIITKGMKAIPEILATPYRRGWFITTNDLYRPLSLVMFAAEWQLGSGDPGISHIMNLLVYAGCVILLFFFLDALFERKRTAVAFIAALLFAVHPIHTEVVANIKSRDELLCFFFAFLSLNVFLKYLKTGKTGTLVAGAFCFFLSLMSKETVMTMLAIIPLIFYFYRNDNKKRATAITISSVAAAAIFLAIRFSVLIYYHANSASYVEFMDNILVKAPSLAQRLGTAFLILGMYVKLLVVPAPLICDYCYNSIPFVGFSNIWVLLSLALYLFMGIYGIMRFVKDRKDPYAFGILFYLVTISLFSNIVFIIGSAMAERFVFFPSAGFCLVAALLIDRLLADRDAPVMAALTSVKVLAVIVPVSLVFAYMTHERNTDWANNFTLFDADAKKAPQDSRLAFYLGTEMTTTRAESEGNPEVRRQLMEDGVKYLKKALEIYPEYNSAHSSIGNAYFHMGQYDSAEVHGKKALEINSKDVVSLNNLAGVYFIRKDYRLSIELCDKALAFSPNYVNALSNKGLCYLRLTKYDSAVYFLNRAIAADPNFSASYETMTHVYRAMGNADSVRKYKALANERNPNFN